MVNSSSFAERVTDLCFDHYERKLTKRGKPQRIREWTTLAAIVESVAGSCGGNEIVLAKRHSARCADVKKQT